MNRVDLITAALSDAHREDYTPFATRFLQEAEALISSRLEFYSLEYTLTDADRVVALSPVYNQPPKVTLIKEVLRGSDGFRLDQVDEGVISQWQNASVVLAYVIRPKTLMLAGVPGAADTFLLQYFGMPPALVADTDTNTLLNDYPQLYKEAIQVSVYKRAVALEMASAMFQSVNSLIDELNRKMKKLIGGARSSNPYNTQWRSSY